MPGTTITSSANIALLDSKIISDLCTGIFSIDVTPSIFLSGGASNVLGASVKITNPYGVIIKNYPTSGYDIYAPMTADIDVSIPTQTNNYQYGQYTIEVQLTDADGDLYSVIKTITLTVPDTKNKTRNYGSLSAQINGNCKSGKVTVIADTVPAYQGVTSNSQVNDFTLEYPTSSGKEVLETTVSRVSDQLFEGVHKFKGTICANYNIGDNVSVKVNYKVKKEKNIRCLLDRTCIAEALAGLHTLRNADCTDAEKKVTQDKIVDALRLITTIDSLADAGFDISEYIDDLEDVLGCVCTCNCADGTPVINQDPVNDFVIEGCNVELVTVGLTNTYTIDNFEYKTEITANGGVLTITEPTLNNCRKTQTITFNIAPLYTQIKAQIINEIEENFWASIIDNSWDGLDVACLGYDDVAVWNALTFKQKGQVLINGNCAGGNCDAQVSSNSTSVTGADVNVSWVSVTGVYEVAVYMDDILKGVVLNPTATFKILGAADGTAHTYKIVAKCANGSIGNVLTGSFTYFGCPTIAVPTVSDSNVEDTACPYDLTALVGALPAGITAEWHNLNNTLATSLVPNPASVVGGTYFVFAKDANGCYSSGTQVIVTCTVGTACSAPQNLLVEAITGGFRVRFQSAAYPPPSNSYTVKRRLTADPDTGGSYTTIGTPTWDATSARWQILDATAINNTLYTYRAISNCASSSPYVDYVFANLTCPVLTLTPGTSTMGYSFTGVGGGVDKYEVIIYDTATFGMFHYTIDTVLHTDTHLPAFSSPITGTFLYLESSTTYKVAVRPYIGTYSKDCPKVTVETEDIYTAISTSYGTSQGSACGANNTVYIDNAYADIQTGIFVYINPTLTTVLTGYTHISKQSNNEIFLINSSTGQVGATTGVFC